MTEDVPFGHDWDALSTLPIGGYAVHISSNVRWDRILYAVMAREKGAQEWSGSGSGLSLTTSVVSPLFRRRFIRAMHERLPNSYKASTLLDDKYITVLSPHIASWM